MQTFPWIAAAAIVALAFGALAGRAVRGPREEPPGDEAGDATPPALLQRVAAWTLAVGGALAALVVAVLATHGAEVFWTDPRVRLPVTALMLATLAASLAPMIVARARVARRVRVDERDLAILERAPRVQGAAVLVALALWTVALMEGFHAEGRVPMPWVVLVFWSCLLVHALALPVGILLGYRRR